MHFEISGELNQHAKVYFQQSAAISENDTVIPRMNKMIVAQGWS